MKAYSKQDIERFLLAIDLNLTRPCDLIIIGGTAAALAYRVTSFTIDIDTINQITAIKDAYEAAKKSTGLNIPMGPVGVETVPYHYEDRLLKHDIPGLKKLNVFVPEKHDFVLMKMARGQQNDLDTVTEIHTSQPLNFDKLIERITTEMKEIIGDKRRIKTNFLTMFETLFGERKLKEAENRLKGWDLK